MGCGSSAKKPIPRAIWWKDMDEFYAKREAQWEKERLEKSMREKRENGGAMAMATAQGQAGDHAQAGGATSGGGGPSSAVNEADKNKGSGGHSSVNGRNGNENGNGNGSVIISSGGGGDDINHADTFVGRKDLLRKNNTDNNRHVHTTAATAAASKESVLKARAMKGRGKGRSKGIRLRKKGPNTQDGPVRQDSGIGDDYEAGGESLPDLNELLYNHTRSHTRLGGNLLYGGDDDDDDDAPSHDDQHAAKGRDGGLEVGEGVMYVGVTRKKGDGIVRVIGADGIKSDGQNGSIDNDDEVKVNGTAAHANKPSSINFDNAAVPYNAKSAVDGSNTGNSANDERKTDSLKVKAAFVVGHSEGKSIKARQASSPSHSETGLSQFAQVMQK